MYPVCARGDTRSLNRKFRCLKSEILIFLYVEKRARGLTAPKFRESIALQRLLEGRTDEELFHYARHGYFASHTEGQLQVEAAFIERFRKAQRQRPVSES